MNRLNSPPSVCRTGQRLLSWSPREIFEPTATEMAEFAVQFTREEWGRLCSDRSFLVAMDKDLVDAGGIAGALLKRHILVLGAET
ncbi:MAG: hypothetical protein HY360_11315 [Verrucomicrobia bacterium]|nr:hypothetical protein [Verrucomicrobiota bacterium]